MALDKHNPFLRKAKYVARSISRDYDTIRRYFSGERDMPVTVLCDVLSLPMFAQVNPGWAVEYFAENRRQWLRDNGDGR